MDRGVPVWLEELPGGWTRLRAASVDGQIVGASVSTEHALVDSAGRAAYAYLRDGAGTRGVRGGELFDLDDSAALPWEADDPRRSRGLAVMHGDRSCELGLLAAERAEPASAVVRAGWTLVPHKSPPAAVAVLDSGEAGPALGLLVRGDELHLWLLDDGVVTAEWEFGTAGALVASDRLPSGEPGATALDLIRPPSGEVTSFVDLGWPLFQTDDLGRALATSGPAARVVPPLVRALGLPDAVRAHLLGETDLATASDAIKVDPEPSLGAALARRATREEWKVAAARPPVQRMWGAFAGGAYIAGVAVLGAALLPGYMGSNGMESIWFFVAFVVLALGVSVAASAIRRWWVLRDPSRLGDDGLPAVAGPKTASRFRRWIDGRVPSTALALLLAIGFGVGGLLQWQSDAALLDGGVEVAARVVEVGDSRTRVEWRMPDGHTVTSDIKYRTPNLRAGDTVAVVYNPLDPEHVKAVADLKDVSIYILFGGVAAFCLLAAALTWFRVVDWKSVGAWLR